MSVDNQEQTNEEVLSEQDQSQHTDTDHSAVNQDNQENEHDTQSHDDNGDWTNPEYRNAQIAAVRKKAEEKALERGRQEALREIEEQFQLQMQQQQQANGYQADTNYQQNINGQQPDTNHNLPQQQPSKEDLMRIQKINAYGSSKYNDWQESMNALNRELQINPMLMDVLAVAANLDNGHDILHKLAKDNKMRQELMECRPEALAKKMIKIGMQDAEQSQPKLAPRKPLSEINPAASSAGSNEVSHDQKVKNNADRIRRKASG